jgi:hypothetical protein
MGGTVQYQWCYPIERTLKLVHKKCRNKARIEASVAEAYIVEEVSNFTEKYYKENLPSVHDHFPRYNVVENQSKLSLFQGQFGSASASTTNQLTNEEWHSIMLYVLLNSPEVEPSKQGFICEFWTASRLLEPHKIDTLISQGAGPQRRNFIPWFGRNAQTDLSISSELCAVACGCELRVRSFTGYDVNGFRYHTTAYEESRSN